MGCSLQELHVPLEGITCVPCGNSLCPLRELPASLEGIPCAIWGHHLAPAFTTKTSEPAPRTLSWVCPHLPISCLISFIQRLNDLLWTGILLALEGPSLSPEQSALTHLPTQDELVQEHPENYTINECLSSLIHWWGHRISNYLHMLTDTSFVAKGHCWNTTSVPPHFAFRSLCLTRGVYGCCSLFCQRLADSPLTPKHMYCSLEVLQVVHRLTGTTQARMS